MKATRTLRSRFLYLLGFLAVLMLGWAALHSVTGTKVRRQGPDGRWITDGSQTDWTGVAALVLLALAAGALLVVLLARLRSARR
jgi:biotin transporter BioY